MDTVFALPRQYTFLNYLRCHDDIGWGLDYGFLRQFGVDEVAHKRFLSDYFQGKCFDSEARASSTTTTPGWATPASAAPPPLSAAGRPAPR